MYIIVLAIVVVGSFFIGRQQKEWSRLCSATALTLLLIDYLFNSFLPNKMYNYSGSSVTEILFKNAFFAVCIPVQVYCFVTLPRKLTLSQSIIINQAVYQSSLLLRRIICAFCLVCSRSK